MKDLIFLKAEAADIPELTNISIRSFHSDYEVGAPDKIGGPSGYDSEQFHNKMMKDSQAFYKILIDKKIIGGLFIFDKEISHCYIGRIFLDPDYHRKGYGAKSMNFLFHVYPHVKKWSLETPPWNTRTMNFYLKLGFYIVKETEEDLFFEKIIS